MNTSIEVEDFMKVKKIEIWGCNFEENTFTNDNILIENFPSINFLYICDTCEDDPAIDYNIEKITLKELPNVETINLYRNNLDKVEFSASFYPKCSYLDVSGNNLKELDLTPFPNLEHLDISHNFVENIDLSKCPNLRTFTCAISPIKDLDLSKNEKLISLILTNTPCLLPSLLSLFKKTTLFEFIPNLREIKGAFPHY